MPIHDSELSLMERAARRAGEMIMTYFRPGENVADSAGVREKNIGNPLTDADLASDRLLRRLLLENRPDYGWLSEESADSINRVEQERVWVVDPIDGTRGFIRGIPQFAISIALVERGRPIAACVHNPATAELFSATRDGGAHRNGQKITTSDRRTLRGARCLASRSEMRRGEWDAFDDELAITPMGSLAYKLALVACGRFDLTFTLTPKCEWDCCAGVLLVSEAGGTISHKNGQPCRFNRKEPRLRSLLASNGPLHPTLLTRLADTPLSPDRHPGACMATEPGHRLRKEPQNRTRNPNETL